jgi:hypothetical protein
MPSTRTQRLLSVIASREDWSDDRREMYRLQALHVFEASLSKHLGMIDRVNIPHRPTNILATAVPERPVSWSLAAPSAGAGPLTLRLVSKPDARLTAAVQLGANDTVVVDGTKLQPGDQGAFLVSPDGRLDVDRGDSVFTVRRAGAVPPPPSPEVLSEQRLIVDAWLAKAAEPGVTTKDLYLFLCLFAIAPMLTEFYDFPLDDLRDKDVQNEWDHFRDWSDAFSDQLLDACAPPGGSVSPAP